MTAFVLKMIAAVSMVIDHAGYAFALDGLIGKGLYTAMRSVGRMAFPIYAFLLVNGFDKSSDRVKYISRLLLFAAISQIPFSLLTFSAVYRPCFDLSFLSLSFYMQPALWLALTALLCAVWFFCVRRDASFVYVALAMLTANTQLYLNTLCLCSTNLNIYYTLALGLICMSLIDIAVKRARSLPTMLLLTLAVAAALGFCVTRSDYGWKGLAIILALFAVRRSDYAQAAVIAAWSILMYRTMPPRMCMALLTLFCPLLYNGKLGRRAKLGFYLIYPLHLLLIASLCIFIA